MPPASRSGHYVPNRAPLQPVPFQKLPPGAIEPRGWLAQQLDLQVNGLCGRYDEISDFLPYDGNGWVDPAQGAWEELPYWLRGFGDLGYVTGDTGVLTRTERWLNGIIATQAPDGWFGPERLRTSLENGPDFWPGMPLLAAFRSWHEYSGDERVIPFMTDYLRFQHTQPAEVFNRSWGAFRWGDNIDSAYWLYNRTGDTWLLELVGKMHSGSADYVSGIPNWHNVNLAQGFREPLQYGLLSGDPSHSAATYRNYATIMGLYGQFPGGGFAGDENSRPGFGDPRQGFETCGIVELMHTFELLTRFTGDTAWTDRCEELAFNLLPASYDAQQKVMHYVTCANSIQLDDRVKHGQFQNGFAMQAYKYGVHQYRCCPHNYGMGWPYYAQELWLATTDNGLAASMYAASKVTAKVGIAGTPVSVVQDTDYPFGDTITFTVQADRSTSFPFYLRAPGWAPEFSVTVNGARTPTGAQSGWIKLERTWHPGDRVVLVLPMRTSTRVWPDNQGSVSVDRGPLTYSLAIDERYEVIGGTQEWPELAVYPESPWNYGLVAATHFDVVRRDVAPGSNPFTHEGTPLQLKANAQRIPQWEADSEDVVGLLQPSPVRSEQPVEQVTLVPMGAARLRITSFPSVAPTGATWRYRTRVTASHVNDGDSLEAPDDGRSPASSADTSVPRFTWWDRRGSTEWIQYDLREAREVSAAAAYWFDDTGVGQCRVPASWRVLWLDGSTWRPVDRAAAYGVERDRLNQVSFAPVLTQYLRVEAVLRPSFSGGLLELTFS
ncbi:beta-L-arabinofuranosidase domain-containing protein [Kribbella sp. CA-293567]|uniref:beta-L-arabinofuranosidase domain-containing protein n=1 Tax=Kribbella sp. CA-293567 TaxID=3002436 RepID=UPI0022DDD345|nr:beta-L-arabinofuranosidase domain-containing protein [Kribbella sp. CA-293567]WBQ05211.1 glycoside hydrolase family 127 protein [Kribbella sp. CA-293567]